VRGGDGRWLVADGRKLVVVLLLERLVQGRE
jgi:hypothetical protein